MSPIPSWEAQHLEAVGIDPAHVKEHVGTGAQSLVRRLVQQGRDKVVKSPLWQICMDPYSQTVGRFIGQSYESAQRELETCQKYFPDFVIDTKIYTDGKKARFSIVQDKLDMQPLTPEIVQENTWALDQLWELTEANAKMMREEHVWFDAMGWDTRKFMQFMRTGKPYLQNVAADMKDERLKLFDYGLFPLPQQLTLRNSYYQLLLNTQRANMKKYGMEFGK